jgi:chemosensory pili system protein ChpC
MIPSTAKSSEIYSLMIPTIKHHILLPNISVAEIIPFSNVQLLNTKIAESPWFLGYSLWRGLKIPLISIDLINGEKDPQANKRSRVAIIHTLNGNKKLPYLAIIVQGIPRLSYVTQENIHSIDSKILEADKIQIEVDSISASIPDLDKLESMVANALSNLDEE